MYTAFYHDTISVRSEQEIFVTKKSICSRTKGTETQCKGSYKIMLLFEWLLCWELCVTRTAKLRTHVSFDLALLPELIVFFLSIAKLKHLKLTCTRPKRSSWNNWARVGNFLWQWGCYAMFFEYSCCFVFKWLVVNCWSKFFYSLFFFLI